MTFPELCMIGAGGFLGAVLRYMLSTSLNHSQRIPLGTLGVNWLGSFLIGCVFGWELPQIWTLFLVAGFAGALTTFSTLNQEQIELWQGGNQRKAIVYVLITYGGGLFLAWLGYWFASK